MLTHLTCEVDHQVRPVAECLRCAATWGKKTGNDGIKRHCHIPYPVIQAIAMQGEGRKDAGISVTMLTDCLRKSWYESRIPYSMYPTSAFPAQHGTAMHDFMEKHTNLSPQDVVTEVRFFKKLSKTLDGDQVLSGQMDIIWWQVNDGDGPYGILADYKAKKEVFYTAPENYVRQLQTYQWMLTTGCEIRRENQPPEHVRLAYPIKRLILYPMSHNDIAMVDVSPLRADEMQAFGMDILARVQELQKTEAVNVKRLYPNPQRASFCTKICPFQQLCIDAGQA